MAVEVFDVTAKPSAAKVADHVLFIQPDSNAVQVNEIIEYQNNSNLTYNDPKNGTVRFFLPTAAKGEAQVTVSTGNMMPLQKSADKTSQANVYSVDSPIKPGPDPVRHRLPDTAGGHARDCAFSTGRKPRSWSRRREADARRTGSGGNRAYHTGGASTMFGRRRS